MPSTNSFIFGASNLLLFTLQISCLEILHPKENYIFTLEVIRNTSATLFDSLQLNRLKNNTLQSFDSIQNLASLTDKNYNSNEITECLFGCNKTTDKTQYDNRTQHFITLINEILDEDPDNADEENVTENYLDIFENELQDIMRRNVDDYQIENLDIQYFNRLPNVNGSLDANNDSLIDDESGLNHRRIYKGEHTKFKHYPFMAGILVMDQFQCAGSIINKDLVITAASCVQIAYNNRLFRENPAILSVHVGSSFYQGGGEIIPVMEAYFYPSYNPKWLRHNICILRLQRRMNLNKIKAVVYDKKASPLPANTPTVTVLGWGAKAHSNSKKSPWENRLSFSHLDFYPLMDCRNVYSEGYVTEENFCAGFISRGGGACAQDVGGPGLVDGILMGVISFGAPVCGAADNPTVFTKLGYYAVWIDSIMDQRTPALPRETTTTERDITYTNPPHFIKEGSNTFTIGPLIVATGAIRQIIQPETEEEDALRNIKDGANESLPSNEVAYEELVKDKNFVNSLFKYILRDDPENAVLHKSVDVTAENEYATEVNNESRESEGVVTEADHVVPNDSSYKLVGVSDETYATENVKEATTPSGDYENTKYYDDELDVDLETLLKPTTTTKSSRYIESRKHKGNYFKTRHPDKNARSEELEDEKVTKSYKITLSDNELKEEIRKIIKSGDVDDILKYINYKRAAEDSKTKKRKDLEKERLTLLYLSDEKTK